MPRLTFPARHGARWRVLHRRYSSRRDGLGRYLPCFCLKIPTGGGKTFLAVKTVDLVNTNYLKRRTGLVLWVVPTTQIYQQTIKSLRDRDHPYRQHLDIASGGRTVIREKGDHFTPQDVSESLVVLMLMLPSANREDERARCASSRTAADSPISSRRRMTRRARPSSSSESRTWTPSNRRMRSGAGRSRPRWATRCDC